MQQDKFRDDLDYGLGNSVKLDLWTRKKTPSHIRGEEMVKFGTFKLFSESRLNMNFILISYILCPLI